jgi:hypothetical protein
LFGVEIFMGTFFHAMSMQLVVSVGLNAVACQAALHAHQWAAIQGDDGAASVQRFQQLGHVTPHPGDA